MVIRTQQETNLDDPRQRFAWALRGMEYNGIGFLAPEQVLEDWSEHLSKAGFIHIHQLAQHADANGILDLKKLPYQQTIHYQPPVRGQNHELNSSGKWVPVEQEIMKPTVDIVMEMTPQEKAAVISRLKEEGYID